MSVWPNRSSPTEQETGLTTKGAWIRLGVIAAVLSLAVSCSLGPMPGALMLRVGGPSLTLAWDPATPGSEAVAGYSVWYRRFSAPYWTLLGEIPAYRSPQYTVSHDRLGDGLFVFAVSSIATAGGHSFLHSSLDWTASPMSGWYVSWMRTR